MARQTIAHVKGGVIDGSDYLAEDQNFQELYEGVGNLTAMKMTSTGGLAVLLTNKTGSATVKGNLVCSSSNYNNSVELVQIGVPDCIGIFLDSGVADGQPAWVVVAGIAEVYFFGSTTRGHMARVGVSTDTGEVVGQAQSEAVPTSPFATDKHFAEIGHVLESRTGAGLAKVLLHFN